MRTKDQIQLENLYLSIHRKRFLKEGLGDFLSTAGHLVLNIAGIIPGIGDFFDIANALWYIEQEDWFGAALALIACIPAIGPAIEEAGLIGRFMSGAERATAQKGLSAVTKVGNQVSKFQELIKNNSGLIDKVFDAASQNEKLKPYVDKMHSALNAFVGGTPGTETGNLSQTSNSSSEGSNIPSYNL